MVRGGPILNGHCKTGRVGPATDLWKFFEAVKAGAMIHVAEATTQGRSVTVKAFEV